MEQQKVLTRQDYNRMIADILIASIEKYPDWRFGQHLRNLELIKEIRNSKAEGELVIGWVDEFNLEPSELVKRAGGYRGVLERLGAYVKDNAKLAAKRLKVDDHSQRVKAAREAKELRK